MAHFELKIPHHREEIHVSTTLSVTINGSLNHRGAWLNSHQRIGKGQTAIIVGVDAYGHADMGYQFPHDGLDLMGKGPAIRIA